MIIQAIQNLQTEKASDLSVRNASTTIYLAIFIARPFFYHISLL